MPTWTTAPPLRCGGRPVPSPIFAIHAPLDANTAETSPFSTDSFATLLEGRPGGLRSLSCGATGLTLSLLDDAFVERACRAIDAGDAAASDFKLLMGFSAWAPSQLDEEWVECEWLGAHARGGGLKALALSQPAAEAAGSAEAEEAREVADAIAEGQALLCGEGEAQGGAWAADAPQLSVACAHLHEVCVALRLAPRRASRSRAPRLVTRAPALPTGARRGVHQRMRAADVVGGAR